MAELVERVVLAVDLFEFCAAGAADGFAGAVAEVVEGVIDAVAFLVGQTGQPSSSVIAVVELGAVVADDAGQASGGVVGVIQPLAAGLLAADPTTGVVGVGVDAAVGLDDARGLAVGAVVGDLGGVGGAVAGAIVGL